MSGNDQQGRSVMTTNPAAEIDMWSNRPASVMFRA